MRLLLMVAGGLVVWGAVTGKSAGSGGPPTAATEIPTHGGHGSALVVVLAVVALVALIGKAGGGGRPAAVRTRHRHEHGHVTMRVRRASVPAPVLRSEGGTSRRDAVRHEKGHVRALRRSGAGGGRYSVKRHRDGTWSGKTVGHSEKKWNQLPAWKQVGVLAAGRHAAPGTKHIADDAGIEWVLAGVPGRDQGRELRRGESAGRRWAR